MKKTSLSDKFVIARNKVTKHPFSHGDDKITEPASWARNDVPINIKGEESSLRDVKRRTHLVQIKIRFPHRFTPPEDERSTKLTAYGFLAVAFMVVVMVFIGGLTRLTGSGLSIVEWKPISGILPPFSQADWLDLFSKYQMSPEFMKINMYMDVEAFKSIFWLEYIHRVWGRLIGFVLLIPTILVLKDSILRQRFLTSVIALWILGGFQGFLGWYMVKSGLIDDPHVSPYRLTVHLGMAFLILWVSLRSFVKALPQTTTDKVRGHSERLSGAYEIPKKVREGARFYSKKNAIPFSPFVLPLETGTRFSLLLSILIGFVIITALFGGLVAGHKAGLIYNTFPLMDGEWLPDGMWVYHPFWRNIFENPGTIQFIHRVSALLTLTLILSFGVYAWYREPKLKLLGCVLTGLVTAQVTLGVLTLIYQVPVYLAAFHQLFAFLLFSASVIGREQIA